MKIKSPMTKFVMIAIVIGLFIFPSAKADWVRQSNVTITNNYINGTGNASNFINKSGDIMDNVDTGTFLNRFRFNMPVGYTADNNSVISLGGEYDGSGAFGGQPVDTYSTQGFFQATNDGTAGVYLGVIGYADSSRDAAEIAGIGGMAYGNGAVALYGVGGTNAQEISALGYFQGYADNGIYIMQQGTGNLATFSKYGGKTVYIGNDGVINSNVHTGTSPFSVSSTTVNLNLNAELWNGYSFPALDDGKYLYNNGTDLRWQTVSGGGGGDTDYLMLNTSNNPLTGNLEISKSDPELKLIDSLYSRFTRSDTNNKAVVYNQITKSLGGAVDSYALDFDGSSNYVDAGNSATLQPASAITVEAWVNLTADQYGGIVCTIKDTAGSDEGQDGYALVYYSTSQKFRFYIDEDGSGDWKYAEINDAVTLGKWYHVIGRWDGSEVSIWLNGIKQTTTAAANKITYLDADTKIGSWDYNGGAFYFTGKIDEARVYDIALSEAIIKSHYANSSGQYGWVETGLKAGYHFDENTGTSTADYSGNANTGTINGATWSAGVKAEPIGPTESYQTVLDGTDGKITVADSTDWDFGADDYTIEFWVNADTLSNPTPLFEHSEDANNALTCWRQNYGTDDIYFGSLTGGAWDILITGTTVLATGNWYHVVIVKSGTGTSETKIYINGVDTSATLVAGAWAGNVGDFSGDFNFGYEPAITANYFDGKFDEVRIYKGRALTPTEITTHYAAGAGLYGTDLTNMVLGLHFDEGGGLYADDYSGNNNVGTLVGGVSWASGEVATPVPASSTIEVSIISSENSPDVGIEGIQKFGTLNGKTIIQGAIINITTGITKNLSLVNYSNNASCSLVIEGGIITDTTC